MLTKPYPNSTCLDKQPLYNYDSIVTKFEKGELTKEDVDKIIENGEIDYTSIIELASRGPLKDIYSSDKNNIFDVAEYMKIKEDIEKTNSINQEFISLVNQGKTDRQLSELYKITKREIYKRRKSLGLKKDGKIQSCHSSIVEKIEQ